MKTRRKSQLLASAAAFLALGLVFAWLWSQGAIQARLRRWLDERVVQSYVARIQPHVPFKIEDVQVDGSLGDLASGKLSTVRVVLSWLGYRLRLEGPLELSRDQNNSLEVWVIYSPRATIESEKGTPGSVSAPLTLEIGARIQPVQLAVSALSFAATAPDPTWRWKLHGLEAEKPIVSLEWALNEPFEAVFEGKQLTWTAPGRDDQAVNLVRPRLSAGIPLELKPKLRIGPLGQITLAAKSVEALFGQSYLDIPLDQFPAALELEVDPDQRLDRADLRIGRTGDPGFSLKLRPAFHPSGRLRTVAAEWRSPALAAPGLVAWLKSLPQLQEVLGDLTVRKGSVSTQGKGQLALTERGHIDLDASELEGALDVKGVDLRWDSRGLAAKGLSWKLPLSTRAGIRDAWIEAGRVAFRRFTGKLERTPFSLLARSPKELRAGHVEISAPRGIRLQLDSGLPLKLGRIHGRAAGADTSLSTSVVLENADAAILAAGLCVAPGRVPPARVHVEFPRIDLTGDELDLQGSARVELLGGTIDIGELIVYDLRSEYPELSFDVIWKGLRLQELDRWSRFGEMDGLVEGYATDFTIRDGRATGFDFLFAIRPDRRKDIVFSAAAMENFVKLLSGKDLSHIPGIARWVMFGLPAKLTGGYDIDYAGVKALSSDGYTHIETLDPVRTALDRSEGREEKHYILKGDRFKIPLNSSRYPLVMDAAAIGTTVGQIARTFAQITEDSRKKGNPDEASDPEDADQPCLAPEL